LLTEQIDDLPWLVTSWERLVTRFIEGRLPHALLLEGRRGIGKLDYASLLAQRLLCTGSAATAACGQCKQCLLSRAQSHPDKRICRPQDSKVIKVDQIRGLGDFALGTPQVARRKVIILDSADQLNINAGNALLKTLEEPNADVTLILLHQAGKALLPTIRSRCQSVLMPEPSADQARAWLEQALSRPSNSEMPETTASEREQALSLAGDAPLLALSALREGIVGVHSECREALRKVLKKQCSIEAAAKPFTTLGLESSLLLMEQWAGDVARLAVGGAARDESFSDVLGYLASRNPRHAAHALLEQIAESRQGLTYNVNPELEISRLLLEWQAMMPAKQRRSA
jgi:DNA polymerase-3 subunit delta'